MTASAGRRDRLRSEVSRKLDQVRALIIMSGRYNYRLRNEYENVRSRLPRLTVRELDKASRFYDAELERLVEELRPVNPLQDYVEALRDLALPVDHHLWVPHWHLRELLPGIETLRPDFSLLPEHARIALDVHGLRAPSEPGEVRILEAGVFEDLCVVFNAAQELAASALKADSTRRQRKSVLALRRASVLGSFYLVEAYLNSIAFDCLVQHAGRLTEPQRDVLSEWDSKRNRARLVNFRDKLLQYPKIAVGAEHPPLQESNCPEFRVLLNEAKVFRDAIVHASPKPEGQPFSLATMTDDREMRYWQIGHIDALFGPGSPLPNGDLWIEIVDAAIGAVRRIETVVHGHTRRLFWLRERNETGVFADDVFE